VAYAAQVIIAFSLGNDSDLISKSIAALKEKAKSRGLPTFDGVLTEHPASEQDAKLLKGFFAAFGKKPGGVRIYLLGHADWLAHRLGVWSSEQAADLLKDAGFTGNGVISMIGCEAARNIWNAYPPEVKDWEDSLATKLHYHLKNKYEIKATLCARIKSVGVISDIHKEKFDDPQVFAESKGRKFVLLKDDVRANKEPSTKLIFYWDDNKQMCEWAY